MPETAKKEEKLLFKEAPRVLELINQLLVDPSGITAAPAASGVMHELPFPFSYFTTTFEDYHEEPQLLDRHLEQMVTPLVSFVADQVHALSTASDDDVLAALAPADLPTKGKLFVPFLQTLYSLLKIRGVKVVVRFFPNQAHHLGPLVQLLERLRSPRFALPWEGTFTLLAWLHLLLLAPFDVNAICLAHGPSGATPLGLVPRIVALVTPRLSDAGRTRDGAAMVLTRLLTRADASGQTLEPFLALAQQTLAGATGSQLFLLHGVLEVLAGLFQQAHRQTLLPIAGRVLSWVAAAAEGETANPLFAKSNLLRKFVCKVMARVGLALLPPRVAAWRYQRGCRSLLLQGAPAPASSAGGSPAPAPVEAAPAPEEADDQESDEVMEMLGQITNALLSGLRDKDTIVRWSAAKGLGRLTNRLSAALGDQIVQWIIGLLEPSENAGAWHGACLALAELARRSVVPTVGDVLSGCGGLGLWSDTHGLLLPARLPEVVPRVLAALQYETLEGLHPVGAHVRDASCYVLWAFARAYAPVVMGPYMDQLARALVLEALFDREINCRRAASAAFQEHVGRQGTFPHGIEVMTAIDYFLVGNRAHTYTQTAVTVAQECLDVLPRVHFHHENAATANDSPPQPPSPPSSRHPCRYPEYREAILDHLAGTRYRHWDLNVRQLAAQGLGRLAAMPEAQPYLRDVVLPRLLPECLNEMDVPPRHGALLACAEIALELSRSGFGWDQTTRYHGSICGEWTLCLGIRMQRVGADIKYGHGTAWWYHGICAKTRACTLEPDLRNMGRLGGIMAYAHRLSLGGMGMHIGAKHMPGCGPSGHAGVPDFSLSFVGPLPDPVLASLRNVLPELDKRRLYRGRGGENVRVAACRLVECLAQAHVTLRGPNMLKRHREMLYETLTNALEPVQMAAAATLEIFAREYYPPPPPGQTISAGMLDSLVRRQLRLRPLIRECTWLSPDAHRVLAAYFGCYPLWRTGASGFPPEAFRPRINSLGCDSRAHLTLTKHLDTDDRPAFRRGAALGLGALPAHLLAPRAPEVLASLCRASLLDSAPAQQPAAAAPPAPADGTQQDVQQQQQQPQQLPAQEPDAETRRNCVAALAMIARRMGTGQ
ncbi:putative Tubulin-specific chaperone D [Paratrimastix pyriformis]|uniref:Tubulin-specific chaperone D n=1 Tax=Paratrimastix pyriformis TaxID=342808 RepID=A0ABQ8UIU1_9EUKA|nr:putative Tubulin-specific chaperone D [Paratrimastix pyriformis]